MKPRRRKIDALYFRWGKFVNMGASDVAKALSQVGVIVMDGPEHYREVDDPSIQGLSREKFEELVSKILTEYSERTR